MFYSICLHPQFLFPQAPLATQPGHLAILVLSAVARGPGRGVPRARMARLVLAKTRISAIQCDPPGSAAIAVSDAMPMRKGEKTGRRMRGILRRGNILEANSPWCQHAPLYVVAGWFCTFCGGSAPSAGERGRGCGPCVRMRFEEEERGGRRQ